MKTTKRYLQLSFKGDRNYLHGSDIYNRINELAAQLTGHADAYLAKIAFHGVVRNRCEIRTSIPSSKERALADGRFVYGAGHEQDLWLIETDHPVNDRYPFDEDAIVNSAKIDHRCIILTEKTEYTPIEEAIALTKALDNKLIPPVKGKWLFGKLLLRRPFFGTHRSIKIQHRSTLAGRYAGHDIFQDDHLIGEIFFIIGAP